MNASAIITVDEKRSALQELLQSVTLRRAEQLRQFLEYIVEEDIAGRGAQIRECDIAVRALHRPANYSPETDSTVRTRAHSLRQRLAEYYKVEAPHAEIRIELPKGGYTPRFVRAFETEAEPVIEEPVLVPTLQPPLEPAPVPQRPWLWILAGIAAGILVSVLVAAGLYARGFLPGTSADGAAAGIAEAWAPVLASTSPVKIVMSSPYQLWVRDYRNHAVPLVDPADSPPLSPDPRILRGYSENWPLYPDSTLYLHGNSAGALWGDAAGVQVATRFLAEHGVPTELVPEKSLKSGYVFRNDSYLAFGRSEYSPLMAGNIPPNGLDVQYIPSIRRHGIARRGAPESGLRFVTSGTTNYGLITIIRDVTDAGQPRQAMFFAGVISNGAQGGIEYMTTPRHVEALKAKLKAEGLTNWPKVMQVVVRSEMAEFYPIRTEYETHLVLQQ